MAAYADLRTLAGNDALRNKAEVAVIIAANDVLRESPSAPDEQIGWAQAVLQSPAVWAQRALWLALAQNSALTTTQIQNASDAALQSAIDAVVPVLAKGFVPGA